MTMPQRTDTFDLERLNLRSGEGRRLELAVPLDRLQYGGEPYDVLPTPVQVTLDISRMTHAGYALRLRFTSRLHGPCMRCLEPAEPEFPVDVREISQPGAGDELQSPYVGEDGELDLTGWARDALSLAVPDQILCKPDCAGLCPVCGENLNEAGPEHRHEAEPDPRWAKLRELKFD
jgi:uncharacterized protein